MEVDHREPGRTAGRLPRWLKVQIPGWGKYRQINALLDHYRLNTVCRHAACPNIGECYGKGTATFLILGDRCTRNCRYCNINTRKPLPPDPAEPAGIAAVVRELRLEYVVITSVTRDDLADGGAAHFSEVVRQLRTASPGTGVELLVPDFRGCPDALPAVLDPGPDVLGHNLETVKRLFPRVRPQGDYAGSLNLLRSVKNINPTLPVKSGIMIGLGETGTDIEETLRDMLAAGVELVTLGQYLRPGRHHIPVTRYYHPGEFEKLKSLALAMGFKAVAAGPLVRSSYRAGELYSEHTHHP